MLCVLERINAVRHKVERDLGQFFLNMVDQSQKFEFDRDFVTDEMVDAAKHANRAGLLKPPAPRTWVEYAPDGHGAKSMAIIGLTNHTHGVNV